MIDQGFVGNISQEDLNEKGKRKLHHYVPIWFQRGFTDDDGLLWTADKNHGEPQRISPKMLFAENRLNQVRDPDTSDGHPRVMLDGEDAFAELDGDFSRTVRSVLERTAAAAAARHTTVDMDRETRHCLQQFVVMQFLRNHGKWMQKYVAAGEPEHLVKAATINTVLGLHNEPDQPITSTLDSCYLQMAIAPGKGTLILGDEPVCLTVHDYYNNKTRPQAGHGWVGIPLDRRTFVRWGRNVVHRRDKAPLLTLPTRELKDINRTILEQSNRIAGPDRHVIHALLKAHRARHRVGVMTRAAL